MIGGSAAPTVHTCTVNIVVIIVVVVVVASGTETVSSFLFGGYFGRKVTLCSVALPSAGGVAAPSPSKSFGERLRG